MLYSIRESHLLDPIQKPYKSIKYILLNKSVIDKLCITHVFETYVFETLSIFQSQFIEKCVTETEHFVHIVVLLLFLFTLDNLYIR